MDYAWIEEYCMAKNLTEKEYKPDWQAALYKINGKMFVMHGGDKQGKPIVTVKLEPMIGQTMRNTYPHIVAGYYMNKEHWNSVYLEGNVPMEVIKKLIDSSYDIIFHSFSKKIQRELLAEI